MESLQRAGSRRHQDRHPYPPNVANLHCTRNRSFHRKHLLFRTSQSHGPETRKNKSHHTYLPPVLHHHKLHIRTLLFPLSNAYKKIRPTNRNCHWHGPVSTMLHYRCKSGNPEAASDQGPWSVRQIGREDSNEYICTASTVYAVSSRGWDC